MPDFLISWAFMLEDFFASWGNLISALAGGLVATVWGPKIKFWMDLRSERNKRRQEKIKRRAKYLEKKLKNKIAPDRVRKFKIWFIWQFAANTVLPLAILICIIILVAFLSFEMKEHKRETRQNRVQMYDKIKKDMYFKTIRKSAERDEKEEVVIARQETICTLKALIESEKIRGLDFQIIFHARRVYKHCMLVGGWFLEPCQVGEKDCVEILPSSLHCLSLTKDWLKDGRGDWLVRICEKRLKNLTTQN